VGASKNEDQTNGMGSSKGSGKRLATVVLVMAVLGVAVAGLMMNPGGGTIVTTKGKDDVAGTKAPVPSSPEAALKSVDIPKAPEGMVWIPGGEFTMGTDDPDSMPDERPAHRVKLDGFFMDKTAVTNAQFQAFVEATGYVTVAERKPDWEEIKKQVPPGTPKPDESVMVPGALVYTPPKHPVPLDNMAGWWKWTPGASWKSPEGPGSTLKGRENHPVVQIAWDDAVAYAKWAGKTLPSEAQWEYASRGGLENKRFSWGNEFMPGGKYMANTYQGQFPVKDSGEDGFTTVAPVGSFPANGYGLYDMAGNVWNWCQDYYLEENHAMCKAMGCMENPTGPAGTRDTGAPRHVIKGGSFLCNVNYCESYRPSARRGTPSDTGSAHVGFRCVKVKDAVPEAKR
jgi:formylglycine-generating enzyme